MCGPIALALPGGSYKDLTFYYGRFLYNIGRVVTYSFMGAIFGLIGKNFALAGLQNIVSVVTGIVIIVIVILPGKYKTVAIEKLPFSSLTNKLKKYFSAFYTKGTLGSLFFIGLLNGFLPCGFVYVGLAGALSTGNVLNGILYMALFGLGTVPVMFAASLAGSFVSIKIRHLITKAIPVLAVILALIFILRGLNLGIKYISPAEKKMHIIQQDTSKNKKPCCE